MKKRLIFFAIAVAIVLVGVLINEFVINKQQLTDTYSGTIEGTLVPVQAELGGKIVNILVEEGQKVKQGDVIAKMDESSAKIALATAKTQLKQAQARLEDLLGGARAQEIRKFQAAVDQAKAGLEQIQAVKDQLQANAARDKENMQYEQKQLTKTQNLYKEGTVSSNELDAQTHRYNVAKAQYEASKAGLESSAAQYKNARAQLAAAQSSLDLALAGYTKPTIVAQKAAVEGAQEAVNLAQLNLARMTITSPIDGIIQYKHLEIGQVVTPGARVVTILEPSDMWVKVYVPEAQLDQVAKGRLAEISVDAYPHQKYGGEISKVADIAEFTPKNVQTKEERTSIVFAVKVKIREGLDKLKPGMPADVLFK